MRAAIRLLAVLATITIGATSAHAYGVSESVFPEGEDFFVLSAWNGHQNYAMKCCKGDWRKYKWDIVGTGDFIYDGTLAEEPFPYAVLTADLRGTSSGIPEDLSDITINLALFDFDAAAGTFGSGAGELNDPFTGDPLVDLALKGKAKLEGNRIEALLMADGNPEDLLFVSVRIGQAIPEPTAALVFGIGLVVVSTATRKKA